MSLTRIARSAKKDNSPALFSQSKELNRRNDMLTGRHVFYILLGFFGVIFAVNGVFAFYAVTGFSGVETKNAYEAGLTFDRDIKAAREQNERGWKVAVERGTAGDGSESFKVVPKDNEGNALTGLSVSAQFKRPVDAALDRKASLKEVESGVYETAVALPARGQWIFELTAQRGERELFRSRNRIMVK
jgi:nitrogen fixation protein FixH